MFFQKSWTAEADNATSIGTGWSLTAAAGVYAQVISGAVGPTATSIVLTRRSVAAAIGGELYAEATLTAADTNSEIYVGFTTAIGDTELNSAGLYARYNGSNTRFQILRKTAGSATLSGVGSSLTQALVIGDVMRLTVHATTATLSINGTTVITASLSGNTDASNYRYPALRFRNSTASRITTFKTGDYGVETDPGGSDPLSNVTGGEFFVKSGGALVALNYIGMKVGGTIVQTDLELAATPPAVYPSDDGYGPDPAMTNAPALPVGFTPIRTVNVSTAPQLQAAILDATPGDLIELAAGLYNDKFILQNLHGTADDPIVIRGPKEAILQLGDGPIGGGDIDYGSGYALAVDQSSYIWCVGFSVQYAPKGIMCDEAYDCWFKGLTISWVEQEALHLRNYSSRNVVEDCIVHSTGKGSPGFGEAYYVGTAQSNWSASTSRTGGAPDACNDNVIRRCRAYDFTGEGVDIKEGTYRTLVEHCWFDGSLLNDYNSADTWVDVKGNDSIIQYNYGQKTFNGAYSVYNPVAGTGLNNIFKANVGDTRHADGSKSPDVSINIKVSGGGGNIVYADNNFVGSLGALTNISVTPV